MRWNLKGLWSPDRKKKIKAVVGADVSADVPEEPADGDLRGVRFRSLKGGVEEQLVVQGWSIQDDPPELAISLERRGEPEVWVFEGVRVDAVETERSRALLGAVNACADDVYDVEVRVVEAYELIGHEGSQIPTTIEIMYRVDGQGPWSEIIDPGDDDDDTLASNLVRSIGKEIAGYS